MKTTKERELAEAVSNHNENVSAFQRSYNTAKRLRELIDTVIHES